MKDQLILNMQQTKKADSGFNPLDACVMLRGDCLEEMQKLENSSVDAIIADPPYGTTACKWDSIIPLEPMWEQLKRVIKPNGAIVMTASQPFTTTLIASNMKMFKYCWVWNKKRVSNPAMAKKQPLRNTEDVIVFNSGIYYPQGLIECKKKLGGNKRGSKGLSTEQKKENYKQEKTNYPRCLLEISADNYGKNCFHPTQKPVALMEYLIKTYTNEGDTVLDFAMGSGTTGVACKNLNRRFIGIEKNEKYFEIAKRRIEAI